MRQPDLDAISKQDTADTAHPSAEAGVDETFDQRLRAGLDPAPEVVLRVTRSALASEPVARRQPILSAPALALSLLLVLGLGGLLMRGFHGPAAVESAAVESAAVESAAVESAAMESAAVEGAAVAAGFRSVEIVIPTSASSADSPSEPILHLSNENGFVTVTNAQGSRWVVLPSRAEAAVDPTVRSTDPTRLRSHLRREL